MIEETMRTARKIAVMLACLLPVTSQAAEPDEDTGRFGVALNTSINGEVYPMRLVPTVSYSVGKTQLEAGIGLHPFIRKDQRVLSGEFNYKYFPNGMDNKVSLYVIGRASYVNNARETFYPTTYHYLFLNGGYGLNLSGSGKAYVGTNVTAGAYSFARRSANPYAGFEEDGFMDKVGLNLAFQFNLGYRF